MFLDTLADACRKTGWFVHAYCLMSNHFHLVVENGFGSGLDIRHLTSKPFFSNPPVADSGDENGGR